MGKGHQRARAAQAAQQRLDQGKLLLDQQKAVNPLFLALAEQLRAQQPQARSILDRGLAEGEAFGRLFGADEAAGIAADRERRIASLGAQDEELIGRLLASLDASGQATPDQLARIRGATDLATQMGLSDLGRFRDDTFGAIRRDSASRGLRPDDSPILNEFTESGEEFGRQAEQFVRGLRQRQLEQELEYPLAAGRFGLEQIGTASTLLGRRSAFEAELAQRAAQQRLGLAQGVNQAGAALASSFPTVGNAPAPGPAYSGSGGGALGSILGTAAPIASGLGDLYSSGALTSLGGGLSSLGGSLAGLFGGGGAAAAGAAGAGAGAAGAGAAGSIGLLASLGGLFSDERGKTDIEDLDASAILEKIRPVQYRYRDPRHGAGRQVGILAQDLEEAGLEHTLIRGEDGLFRVDPGKLAGSAMALVADVHRRLRALEEAA